MDRRPLTRGGARKSNRRLKTLLWIGGIAALTIALIYYEQSEILYVLATLGITALLIMVGLADLTGAKSTSTSELGDDAAAIGSGMTGATTIASVPPTARRATGKRK
jgi:Kef-type K+ transport system membrane component KefB